MKTFSKHGLIICVGLFLCFSFTSHRVKQFMRETSVCHDCKNDNFNGVPLRSLVSDIARYGGTHAKKIRPDMREFTFQKDPSRSCTYTLDTLKKFICLVETYSKKAGIAADELAIQFVYGVYPKREIVNEEKYGSLHTLFMVPAVFEPSTGTFEPFDPRLTAAPPVEFVRKLKKMKFKPTRARYYALRDLAPISLTDDSIQVFVMEPRSFKAKSKYISMPAQSSQVSSSSSASAATAMPSYVWNQGMLCPPNCPTADFIATSDQLIGFRGW